MRILGWEGANPRASGMFFKAVVQAVLLRSVVTGVMTPCMGRALGSFQHGVARRIKERQPNIQEEGVWEYPPLAAAMKEAGFEDILDYILKKHYIVAQYITTRPILEFSNNTV